ncbi:hypothetical protein FEE95_20955 [Maribacter algarum]|uniref:Fibronectin type-III domain-containing protein n=1 Tax=Maribacter algarum (ex Zhang et al. 2020) TaxID=2578118 RepID=A0A5S3PDV2_9FLAO|nr:hypothetical protein [Maribacter algarum]TMM52160.1 hypothetical protein FEE95_20955 [Maribacter algarum]
MKKLQTLLILTVLILFSSCEDLLEVPDISMETVQLLAPSDSTTVVQSNVNFTWDEVYEASQYHVQVAAPSFENAAQIVVDTLIVVDSTFASPRFNRVLTDSDYEWRVRAQNSGYETEFTMHKFSVDTSGN